MRNFVLLAILALSSLPLRADFSYTETSQMTGGAMLNLMRGLGPLARGARDPIVTTHLLKGNRMATITKDSVAVIDLDKETITTIDTGKKNYSVVTFAEMKQAMENMTAKADSNNAKGRNADQAKVNFKVSAQSTGQTKTVNGLAAKQVIMTMTAEGTDDKSGQKGAMDINIDTWIAPVGGYDEVKEFQRKMGAKMGYLFGSGRSQMGQMQPGTLQGFAQVAEEMAKVDGVPVEQVTKMGGTGAAAEGAPAAQTRPTAGDAVAGAIAGRLGGLGGFGRRNKKEEKKEEKTAEEAQPAASGSLVEMTTSLTSFSAASVDASKFEVPAGFKRVENELVKRSR